MILSDFNNFLYLTVMESWDFHNIFIYMRGRILILVCFALLLTGLRSKKVSCGYVQEDGELINTIAKFAACSNVNTNYSGYIKNWTYSHCRDASSDISDLQVITDGEEGTKGSLYLLAFTVYDRSKNLIVVSFRGSLCGDSWKNGKTDFNYVPKIEINGHIGGGCKALSGCRMHAGFQATYKWFREHIRKNVETLYTKYSKNEPRIVVTGISYGAAIAAIAAYDLKLYGNHIGREYDIICYTFGQPRIGNKELIDDINSRLYIRRFVNQADPVPHLPTRGGITSMLINFFHPGDELFIVNSTNQIELTICSGDGEQCSLNRYGADFSVANHLVYQNFDYTKWKSCDDKTLLGFDNQISENAKQKQFRNVEQWMKKSCETVECKTRDPKDCELDTGEKRFIQCPCKEKNPSLYQATLKDFICWACKNKKLWLEVKIDDIVEGVSKEAQDRISSEQDDSSDESRQEEL